MLDPLSALAVAAAAVQFVDFVWKVISRKDAIFNKSNSAARTDELFQVAERLQKLIKRLELPADSGDYSDDIHKISKKCREIQKRLKEPLDRLKERPKKFSSHGGSRKFRSAWHALDKELGEDEIAKLRKELEDLRQDLMVAILIELRENRDAGPEHDDPGQIATPNRETPSPPLGEEFIEEIEEDTRYEWREKIIKAMLGDDVPTDGHQQVPVDQKCASHFLDNLAFKKMFARFENVTTAFDKTFEWLFKSEQESDAWNSFRRWLGEDGPHRTFWMSAKPGAGKSTLMKFIDSHERTEQELSSWAKESRSLIRGSFYFYYGGPELEKSKKGMLLSLLYQIFKSDNDLIAEHCPKRAEIHYLFGKCAIPWSLEDLEEVLLNLIDNGTKKFFFLIDGLDECVEDHGELVEFLGKLSGSTNVKLCVSSRPSPEFDDHFGHGRCHLRLQELTKPDIELYINSKIGNCPAFKDFKMSEPPFAASLVENIAQKSQGVFLWVEFVVNAITPELTAGSQKKDIEKLLERLPEDLEELFRQLLGMIREHHKKGAYEIFRLVEAAQNAKTTHEHLSVLALYFAQDHGQSDTFAKVIDEKTSHEVNLGRCKIINRRLMQYCKGLLEIVPAPRSQSRSVSSAGPATNREPDSTPGARTVEITPDSTVQYMHRTVKEFLDQDGVWAEFSSAIDQSSFDPFAALCRASILQLNNTDLKFMTTDLFWEWVQDALHYAALSDKQAQDPLVVELDKLDEVADRIARSEWPKEPGNLLTRHVGDGYAHQKVPRSIQAEYMRTCHWSAIQASGGSTHSFLCLAVQWGLCSYVQAKLVAGTPVEQSTKDGCRSLLDCVIRDYEFVSRLKRAPPIGYEQRIAMIRILLEHHDDPNRLDISRTTPWIYLQNEIKNALRASKPRAQKQQSRVWLPKQPQYPGSSTIKVDPQRLNFWLSATELFVQHGDCWTFDVKSIIKVLELSDKKRAMELKADMKRRRLSISYIAGMLFPRRKSEVSLPVIEGMPVVDVKISDDMHSQEEGIDNGTHTQ